MIRDIPHFEWLKNNCDINLGGSGIEPMDYQELEEVKTPLYEFLKIEGDEIVVTHGAQEGLFLSFLAVFDKGSKVFVPVPEYDPIVAQLELVGANIIRGKGDNPENLSYNIALSSPNNPLGYSVESLEELSENCSKLNCFVVVDETFAPFVGEYKPFPLKNVIRIGSTTKICNFKDRKAGWVIAEPEIIKRIEKVQELIAPPPIGFVEVIASTFFTNIEKVKRRAFEIVENNERIMRKYGINLIHTEHLPYAYVMADSDVPYKLKERGVLVLPGTVFGLNDGFRISLGIKDTSYVEKGVKIIADVLKREN
ncbi:aminotransferase [Sulfolobales archaeon HS-7]|nr:aminotransferase [Sulfolobales archaeon HS-7]